MENLKFRVYSKTLERMIPFEEIDISGADIYLKDAIKTAEELGELMQFTGLLDKQGKEIYEGDIVKGNRCYGIVYFSVEKGMYKITDAGTWFDRLVKEGIEVIGNIYENPKLIK